MPNYNAYRCPYCSHTISKKADDPPPICPKHHVECETYAAWAQAPLFEEQ